MGGSYMRSISSFDDHILTSALLVRSGWLLAGLLIAILVIAGQRARATDLPQLAPRPAPPPQAAYNWTGVYIGANAAYGSGSSDWTNAAAGGSTGSFPIAGFLAGGTIGANYQAGQFVFGLEGDVDWSNVNGTPGPV